jgi:putative MFS transporter
MQAIGNLSSNSGARLDRLPVGAFHYRLLALIGAGLFLDGFELYLTGGVLGSLTKSGWSTMTLNAAFVSATFFGMVIGAWAAGIIGDRLGRRFAYQFNLLIFGLASLAAVFAQDMQQLIVLRFIMGIGLGAEVVVGYGMLTEFVPARVRGRMIGWLAVITNTSLLVATFLGVWIIPNFGWRYMFLIVGVGAIVIWALRRSLPESPRWCSVSQALRGTESRRAGGRLG